MLVNSRTRIAYLAAAVSVLWTASAFAATYYVSPSGSASNPGTPSSPWSLSKANASLAAGDVAIMAPGNYGSTAIAPANSGTSYSRYIAYVGSLSNPSSTIVTAVSFGSGGSARHHVSVKGVQINSKTMFYGSNDSLAWCVGPETFAYQAGANDCVVANSTFSGDRVWFEGTATTTIMRDTVSNCSFSIFMNGYGPAIRVFKTDGLTLKRCRFLVTIGPNEDHGTFKMYEGVRNTFTDCMFDFINTRTTACDECGQSYFRDNTKFCVFLRDTFNLRGSNTNSMFLSASGSLPNTTQGNRYDGCVFRQEAPTGPGSLYWQNGSRADTIQNCVVISSSAVPISMSGFGTGSLVKNNTFVYLGSSQHAGDTYAGGAYEWSGPAKVQNNIFFAPNAPYAYGVSGGSVSNYTGDHNLVFGGGSAGSSIQWAGSSASPGASGRPCTSSNEECHSLYADPLLVGGTTVWNFDAHLRAGSAAIGAALNGGDIGALPFGTVVGDLVPPAPIPNLATSQVNDNNLLLTWTATGDDAAVGTATRYELKRSSSLITSANFGSATTIGITQTPRAPGSAEQFLVTGLSSNTRYYFAIRAVDEAGNVGLIASSPSATTLPSDTNPPAQTVDLSAH